MVGCSAGLAFHNMPEFAPMGKELAERRPRPVQEAAGPVGLSKSSVLGESAAVLKPANAPSATGPTTAPHLDALSKEVLAAGDLDEEAMAEPPGSPEFLELTPPAEIPAGVFFVTAGLRPLQPSHAALVRAKALVGASEWEPEACSPELVPQPLAGSPGHGPAAGAGIRKERSSPVRACAPPELQGPLAPGGTGPIGSTWPGLVAVPGRGQEPRGPVPIGVPFCGASGKGAVPPRAPLEREGFQAAAPRQADGLPLAQGPPHGLAFQAPGNWGDLNAQAGSFAAPRSLPAASASLRAGVFPPMKQLPAAPQDLGSGAPHLGWQRPAAEAGAGPPAGGGFFSAGGKRKWEPSAAAKAKAAAMFGGMLDSPSPPEAVRKSVSQLMGDTTASEIQAWDEMEDQGMAAAGQAPCKRSLQEEPAEAGSEGKRSRLAALPGLEAAGESLNLPDAPTFVSAGMGEYDQQHQSVFASVQGPPPLAGPVPSSPLAPGPLDASHAVDPAGSAFPCGLGGVREVAAGIPAPPPLQPSSELGSPVAAPPAPPAATLRFGSGRSLAVPTEAAAKRVREMFCRAPTPPLADPPTCGPAIPAGAAIAPPSNLQLGGANLVPEGSELEGGGRLGQERTAAGASVPVATLMLGGGQALMATSSKNMETVAKMLKGASYVPAAGEHPSNVVAAATPVHSLTHMGRSVKAQVSRPGDGAAFAEADVAFNAARIDSRPGPAAVPAGACEDGSRTPGMATAPRRVDLLGGKGSLTSGRPLSVGPSSTGDRRTGFRAPRPLRRAFVTPKQLMQVLSTHFITDLSKKICVTLCKSRETITLLS